MQQTPLLVELSRSFRDRVNKDGANTGDLGSLRSSQDGIAQQRWPDTMALEAWIDGEATEHHYGNRVRHCALDSSGALSCATAPSASG